MTFRTIRKSKPEYEKDGLSYITVKSAALKGRGDISVFTPSQAKGKKEVPVILLLHGVYGSHWAWTLIGGIHHTLQRMIDAKEVQPFILVMPSDGLWGDGSGYIPHYAQDFQEWVGVEVPAVVRQEIEEVGEHSTFYISGLSMGGYGAIRLGALYPDTFKGISAHSSLTTAKELQIFVEEDWSKGQRHQHFTSLIALLNNHQDTLPPLRFDCGKSDVLFEANQRLHGQLTQRSIPHDFDVFEGAHTWEYWAEHIEETYLFCERLRNS